MKRKKTSIKEQYRKQAADSARKAAEHNEKSSSFESYLNDEVVEQVQLMTTKDVPEGENIFDIVPYQAGANDPDPKINEGDMQHVCHHVIHRNIGANNAEVVCPLKNYGLPCPICEDIKRLQKEEGYEWGDRNSKESDKTIKNLGIAPKHRSLFYVWWQLPENLAEKGLQVLEISTFFMLNKLVPLSKESRRGGYVPYFSPDSEVGRSISFIREGTGATNTKFTGHKFVKREYENGDTYDIPEDMLLEAAELPLDSLLKILDYDEIKAMYVGGSSRSSDDEEEEYEDNPAELEETEELETDEDVDENPCPAGGSFGGDFDSFDDCDDCDLYEDCEEENNRLIAKQRKKKSKRASRGSGSENKVSRRRRR